VAIGTSLPELATAVASARRGQTELLIGNLIGSNAFNALGVVGVASLIGVARDDRLVVDTPGLAVVVAGGVVTVLVGLWLWRRPVVPRFAGVALVAVYAATIPLLLAVSSSV
jgi:cation:H+ antiporter